MTKTEQHQILPLRQSDMTSFVKLKEDSMDDEEENKIPQRMICSVFQKETKYLLMMKKELQISPLSIG